MCDVICNEAVPFRPYCAGVATRTRNVSEYMLVLVLCLVGFEDDAMFLLIGNMTRCVGNTDTVQQVVKISNVFVRVRHTV